MNGFRAGAERHLGEVARDPEGGGAARAVLDRGEDDRVRARAPVARALVGAEQEDRRPRLRLGRLRVGEHARVGLERRHLSRAEPLDERPLPGVLRHPLRQRHDHVREEDAAPVTRRAARLLVREDVLEHAVAADGQVAGGDVGSGGERHEHGQSCHAATPDVGNREDAKREHRKVEHEQA